VRANEDDVLRPNGLVKLSTAEIPPIVTRGVLLDIAALRGVAMLEAGTAINRPEIDSACARQGVAIGRGDVVIFHTGYQAMAAKDEAAFLAKEPGLGKGGAEHLASLGVVAVGLDSWAVEVIPSEDPEEFFPVHQILLAKNGIYILENIDTAALAQYDLEALRAEVRRLPVKRMGGAREVALAVAYLASPAADYVTGTTLIVDGGEHLMGAVPEA